MGTITLPNFRATADVTMNTRLKDGGVAIDWAGLSNIKAWLYSDAQKAIAGRCDVSVNPEDNTKLLCEYAASKPQYLGVNRLIVQGRYNGSLKTYDKPVFNFVPRTAEATGSITISDPEVDVEIEVTDVSSSILDAAIAAAVAAAAHAEHAASLVPLQVLQDCEAATAVALTAASKAPVIGENGNWWVWNSNLAAYEDTGNEAQGPTGNGIATWTVEESQEDAGDNVVTVTFTDGTTETFTYKNGHTGNGIASIVQTVESPDDAGTNVITVTMTNGTVITFNVKNGSKGQPGAAQAAYKSVETLPTASAETMDKIYLTPSGTSGVYNMSYTDYDGSAYSWEDLGTTAIQLSDYATKAEFSQLEAKVDEFITFEDLKSKGLENLPGNPGNLEGTYIGTYQTAKFFAVPVKPGQVVVLQRRTSASKYAVVTEFNYTPGTRYNLSFATGHSGTTNIPSAGATFTVPNDAKYVIVNKTAVDGTTNLLPTVFTIDGVNMLPGTENTARLLSTFSTGEQVSNTPLSNEVALASPALVKSGAVHQKVTEPFLDTLAYTRGMPGMDIVQVIGSLESTYIQPTTTDRSYIVIKVNGGEHYYCPAQTSPRNLGAFVQVKSYTYGITQRTNYDLAGDYTSYSGTNVEHEGYFPNDCRFVLIRYKRGEDLVFPTSFVINGYDIGKSIIQNLADVRTLAQRYPISIEKEGTDYFWVNYNNGVKKLRYHYFHYYNKFDSVEYEDEQGNTQTKANVVSSDLWSNHQVYVDNKYIAQGNTNFIHKPEGSGYSGDQHGLEVHLYEKFYLDGNEVDIDAMADGAILYGHIFSHRLKSVVYEKAGGAGNVAENIPKLDTNGNPIVSVVHSMETTIDGNTMDIDNKLIIQKDNFKFAECYGAMLEVYYNVLSDVIVNNAEETINHNTNAVLSPVAGSSVTLSNIYQHGNKVVMVGDTFKVTQESIPVIPGGTNPGVYFNDYADSRLKCYFQPVPTSVRSGGQTAMTFNTGDVVAVKNHRLTEF